MPTQTQAKQLTRPDYHRKANWTYAEAADYAGVAVKTVRKWWSEGCEGRRPWKRGLCRGPLRIDATSFVQWLASGEAKGERLGNAAHGKRTHKEE